MAKEIRFQLGGKALGVQLGSKITKDDLYGAVRRIVEKDGHQLDRGWLTPDGRLLRRGQISSLPVDAGGTPVDPIEFLVDDEIAEQFPSSFDVESPLEAAPITRLADFNTADVYEIAPEGLAPGLYATTFNYRKSFQPRDAFVLVKESGSFLLIGALKGSNLIGKDVSYEFFDAAEDAADESDALDFAMM